MQVASSAVELVLFLAIGGLTLASGELFSGLAMLLLVRIVAVLDDIRQSLDRIAATDLDAGER